MSESQHDPEMMRRREVLRRAAWLLGGAISAPAALAILQGCARQESSDAEAPASLVLGAAQMKVVAAIADIMLPKTDTSGALDAGVPQFIDTALAALYPKSGQESFKAGIEAFAPSTSISGKIFLEQGRAEQEKQVREALEAALTAERDPQPFILTLRELALLGYLNSRVGIAENMEYVPVPTAFHGCVPLSQMKKHVYWE